MKQVIWGMAALGGDGMHPVWAALAPQCFAVQRTVSRPRRGPPAAILPAPPSTATVSTPPPSPSPTSPRWADWLLGPEGHGQGRGAVKLTLLGLAVYGLFALNTA